MKLGKLQATYSPKDIRLEDIREADVKVTVPEKFGHDKLVLDWAMLGNGPDDTVEPGFQGAGDCVFAGAAHETMLWNAEAGKRVKFDGKCVIADYSAVTGYVVGDDSTDEGTDVRTALSFRRKTGVQDSSGKRHKIGAYISLEPGNWEQLLEASYVFSATGVGIRFPSYAMQEFDAGKPWTLRAGGEIDGGHYIPGIARTSRNYVEIVTWARTVRMSKGFFEKYCDEMWAIVSPEMLKSGKTLEGYSMPQLNSILAQL